MSTVHPASWFVLITMLVCCVLLCPTHASACSTCQVGETLPRGVAQSRVNGEQLRLVLDGRYQYLRLGENNNILTINDRRLVMATSYAPTQAWLFGLELPLFWRDTTASNGQIEGAVTIGDLALSTMWRPWFQNEGLNLGLLLGVRAPTAPRVVVDGQAINVDAQPGSGAWMPFTGLDLSYRWSTLWAGAQVSYHHGLAGRFGYRPGHVVLSSINGGWMFIDEMSLTLGMDTRFETRDRFDEGEDPNSGGFLMFMSPGFNWFATREIALGVTTRIPVFSALHGAQREGVIVSVAVGWQMDLGSTDEGLQPPRVASIIPTSGLPQQPTFAMPSHL